MASKKDGIIFRATNAVAMMYVVAAFSRIFPNSVMKEERDPVDSDCLDYPSCMVRSGTLPPTSDNLPFDFEFSNESLLEFEKQARLKVFGEEENLSTPQPDPDFEVLPDQDDAPLDEFTRALLQLPDDQSELKADLDHLASTSLPPRRQFKREVEIHLGMESESGHYSGPYPRSGMMKLVPLPYEGPGLYLTLRVTFVIFVSLLGLSLFIGNLLKKPGFLRGWAIAAGVSTALDVSLLISVAVTSEINGDTFIHFAFLGVRALSFFVVRKRIKYLEMILHLERLPIIPECIDDDDADFVVMLEPQKLERSNEK